MKRTPEVGRQGLRLHEKWSKSTIHEALLDLWMEHNGVDCHPDDMSAEQWKKYEEDVENRAGLVQIQRGKTR